MYERTEFDGDVIALRVVVWQGETTGFWDAAEQRLTGVHKTDVTPVYEYVIEPLGRRLEDVDVRKVEESSDASGTEYGPDTPHRQQAIPKPGEM